MGHRAGTLKKPASVTMRTHQTVRIVYPVKQDPTNERELSIMPRPATTPDKRVRKTTSDLGLLPNAITQALKAVNDGDATKLAEAAKFIEAVGCYARRTAAVLPAPVAAIPATPVFDVPAVVGSLKVAVVGPNLRDQSKGQFVVHAKDCGDLRKLGRSEPEVSNAMVFTAKSRTEIATDVYADQIDEGARIEDCYADFHFCPCVKLPVS